MLVRDGRDTFISLKERFPAADPSGPLVLGRWINDNTAGLLYERDPRLLVVRLEDLTQRPRVHLPVVLAHVGVPGGWAAAAALLAQNYADRKGAGSLGQRATHARASAALAEASAAAAAGDDLLNALVTPPSARQLHPAEPAEPAVELAVELAATVLQAASPAVQGVSGDQPTGGGSGGGDGGGRHIRHLRQRGRWGRRRSAHRRLMSQGGGGGGDGRGGGDGGGRGSLRAGFTSKASGRKGHDELRRFQVSQPLRPVVPKWPHKMTADDKALFKAHAPAMHLLIHLGYANGTDW